MQKHYGKLNILLVEYINRNLGDTVIAESARYFLREALEEAGISDYVIHEYNMYLEDMEYVRHADMIVFCDGGLIKFQREKFHQFVPDIIAAAESADIPVYIHATGVEGYEEADERCARLKKAVNSPCVKGITVRDDFDTFRKHYIEVGKEWLDQVLDSAAFSSEVYGCHQKKHAKKIGLGVVRDGLFSDYGFCTVTKQFQLDFWKGVIEELDRLGYEWEIFNNGLHDDMRFGLEVLAYAGHQTGKAIVSRPAEGHELAEIISGYRGIIACRLHTNIIAFSEGVPSIGLVWNHKLLQWGENIGYPERFVKAEELEARHVVGLLRKAMEEGCRRCTDGERSRLADPLKEFVKKYGTLALEKKPSIPEAAWEQALVCSALGGKNHQYWGMNSPETILVSYEKGFRYFEADIKLTADDRLVCVNGWNAGAYNKLGIPVTDQKMLAEGIGYERFMQAKYYDGHYETMDYEMLVSYLFRMPMAVFILDARNNSEARMVKIAEKIRESMAEHPGLEDRLILRIMSLSELRAVRSLGIKVMYDIPTEEEQRDRRIDPQEIASVCSEKLVEYLSVRRGMCHRALLEDLKQYRKKICAFTYNRISEIVELLEMGVDMVATDYLEVNALNALTGLNIWEEGK